jgi:hypothetical protein
MAPKYKRRRRRDDRRSDFIGSDGQMRAVTLIHMHWTSWSNYTPWRRDPCVSATGCCSRHCVGRHHWSFRASNGPHRTEALNLRRSCRCCGCVARGSLVLRENGSQMGLSCLSSSFRCLVVLIRRIVSCTPRRALLSWRRRRRHWRLRWRRRLLRRPRLVCLCTMMSGSLLLRSLLCRIRIRMFLFQHCPTCLQQLTHLQRSGPRLDITGSHSVWVPSRCRTAQRLFT